jgi:hypothetical protein
MKNSLHRFLLVLAAFFGINAFHAEEDPNEAFVYDRTESVLLLALEARDGTNLQPGGPTALIGVLLMRSSWQIWRQPSTGIKEYQSASSLPQSGARVSLSVPSEMGGLADTTLVTDSERPT